MTGLTAPFALWIEPRVVIPRFVRFFYFFINVKHSLFVSFVRLRIVVVKGPAIGPVAQVVDCIVRFSSYSSFSMLYQQFSTPLLHALIEPLVRVRNHRLNLKSSISRIDTNRKTILQLISLNFRIDSSKLTKR